MSLALIKTQIKTKLEAISGVEKVYDYKRYCNDWVSYQNLFIKDSRVNTWEIERNSFSRVSHGGNGDIEDVTHNFIIRGFYSFSDSLATEKTFQNLVEIICASFMNDPTLTGKAKIVHMPIEGTFTLNKLGDILCHVVEIKINIEERII